MSISARSGVVEESGTFTAGTTVEERFVTCSLAEALTVKATVGAVPLTDTLAEGTPGADGADVDRTAGGTLAKSRPAEDRLAGDRLIGSTLAEGTLDEGRTGSKDTEGNSGGSRNIGDGMKGEGGCAEGSTVGVVTGIAGPDPMLVTGTVCGGTLGGAAVFAGVAANWRPTRPPGDPVARCHFSK